MNTEKPKVFTAGFENVLGTSFDLKTFAISEKTADQAEKIALDEIDRLSAIFSSYDQNSEFSQWQLSNKKPVGVSPELFEAMEQSVISIQNFLQTRKTGDNTWQPLLL